MDCWNYSINWILNNKWIQLDYDEESIMSEYYPEVSILPKIWKVLLKVFPNVIIIHEHAELFINLKTIEEEEIVNEYREELYDYMSKGWKFWCDDITINLLNELIKKNFYCIIALKKENWSHLIVLTKENDKRKIIDNKKWEYNIEDNKLEELINLENWKYVLFCWNYIKETINE